MPIAPDNSDLSNVQGLREAELPAAILREQVALAFKNLPTTQIAAFIVALVLAWDVRTIIPRQSIIVWLLMLLAVIAARILFFARFSRVRDTSFNAGRWKRIYLALAFASGAVWGLSAILLYPSGRYDLICMSLLIMAALSAATTVAHSSLRLGPAVWMAPALFAYSARCLIDGGEIGYSIGALIIVYFLALVNYSLIHYKTITASIELRFENRASEAGYRDLFDSTADAIFILDREGHILDVNKGAQVMYRRGRDSFMGAAIKYLSAPDAVELREEDNPVRRAFDGETRRIEFAGLRADGTSFPQEVTFQPATYRGRQVVIAVARDISERKRAETELVRSQKLEAVGLLAGGIAHDFNNLLQAVFGFLTVARRGITDRDKALHMLEKADRALHLSARLTTQLLTFSKGGKPVRRVIDVGQVVESAAQFALSGSRAAGRFNFEKSLWTVKADDVQIAQVIQNLVLNAVQAMPQGGRVTIAARNVDLSRAFAGSVPGPGRWVQIVVQDAGTGISAENLQHIFEPYFTTKETGSGLGLATSYSIINNHGGKIEVGSLVGQGSTFTVWLPAANLPAPEACSEVEMPVLARKKILVMDDEEMVRDSVGEMLQELGQDVEFTADGASAVERYRAAAAAGAPFAAVILDATVRGGMGGRETIKALKEIDPGVAVVIASGYSNDAVVSDYASFGFRGFLPKPFTLNSLQAVLCSVLS